MRIDTALPTDAARSTGRRRRALSLALTVSLTAAIVGGTAIAAHAYFTSQASVTGQQVATATVQVTAGTAALSSPIAVNDLLPGDTATTRIDVANTGSADVYYSVRLPRTTGDAALESVLEVTVTVGGLSETRTLTAWQTGALQIGPALVAGASQAVTVAAKLPASAANSLQGTATGFSVQFDAIQARNTTPPTAGWVAD